VILPDLILSRKNYSQDGNTIVTIVVVVVVAGISFIVIGVGSDSDINLTELRGIASFPVSSNLLRITDPTTIATSQQVGNAIVQTVCGNINACSSSPCPNSATCTTVMSGYTCTCSDGTSGINCERGELSRGRINKNHKLVKTGIFGYAFLKNAVFVNLVVIVCKQG